MTISQSWRVCAGDTYSVQVPGVAKPISCGSKERALIVSAAPTLHQGALAFAEYEAAISAGNHAAAMIHYNNASRLLKAGIAKAKRATP